VCKIEQTNVGYGTSLKHLRLIVCKHKAPFPLSCALCNQPVPIETANTDGQGRAVHSDCYAETLAAQRIDLLSHKPQWD
jgi:hypothetical protein